MSAELDDKKYKLLETVATAGLGMPAPPSDGVRQGMLKAAEICNESRLLITETDPIKVAKEVAGDLANQITRAAESLQKGPHEQEAAQKIETPLPLTDVMREWRKDLGLAVTPAGCDRCDLDDIPACSEYHEHHSGNFLCAVCGHTRACHAEAKTPGTTNVGEC